MTLAGDAIQEFGQGRVDAVGFALLAGFAEFVDLLLQRRAEADVDSRHLVGRRAAFGDRFFERLHDLDAFFACGGVTDTYARRAALYTSRANCGRDGRRIAARHQREGADLVVFQQLDRFVVLLVAEQRLDEIQPGGGPASLTVRSFRALSNPLRRNFTAVSFSSLSVRGVRTACRQRAGHSSRITSPHRIAKLQLEPRRDDSDALRRAFFARLRCGQSRIA